MPLRLMLGIAFMIHGYPKVFDAGFHAGFVKQLASMNVPAPEAMAWTAGIAEFFGGILLIVGALTWLVSLILIVDMLVAMFKVHWPSGFMFVNITGQGENGPIFGLPGYEVNLLFMAMLLSLVISGAGAASIDCALFSRRRVVEVETLP